MKPMRFLPPRPFLGERGPGGEGMELRLASLRFSDLFILRKRGGANEFTIENPIKTQCKTPHPQPLSPKKGRGEQAQRGLAKTVH